MGVTTEPWPTLGTTEQEFRVAAAARGYPPPVWGGYQEWIDYWMRKPDTKRTGGFLGSVIKTVTGFVGGVIGLPSAGQTALDNAIINKVNTAPIPELTKYGLTTGPTPPIDSKPATNSPAGSTPADGWKKTADDQAIKDRDNRIAENSKFNFPFGRVAF